MRLFNNMSSRSAILWAAVALTAVGTLDYVTGTISFHLFYLLPVGMTAWYVGKRAGLAMGMAAGAVWLLMYWLTHGVGSLATDCWETGIAVSTFCLVSLIVSGLKSTKDQLETALTNVSRISEELARSNEQLALDVSKRIAAEEALRAAHRKLIAAREEERRQISSELHDSIGQQIVAVGLKLQALEAEAKSPGPAAGLLPQVLAQFHQLLEETRGVSRALYPQILEELGLAAALRQLRNDMTSPNARIEANCPPELEGVRFDREVEIVLYRVAQEALSNSLRHAKCQQVSLDLDFDQGQLQLSVMDDGGGFVPEKVVRGRGLNSMRERADMIGASLEITSEPGCSCVSIGLAAQPAAPSATV